MSDTNAKPDTVFIVIDDSAFEGGSGGWLWYFDRSVAEHEYASNVRDQLSGEADSPSVVRLYSLDVSRIDFVMGLDEASKINDEVEDIIDNDFLDEDQGTERLRVFVPENADWSYVWPLLTHGEIGTDLGQALGAVDAAGFVQSTGTVDFGEVVTHNEDWLLRILLGNPTSGSVEACDATFELLDQEDGHKLLVRGTAHMSGIWSGWSEGLVREQVLGF